MYERICTHLHANPKAEKKERDQQHTLTKVLEGYLKDRSSTRDHWLAFLRDHHLQTEKSKKENNVIDWSNEPKKRQINWRKRSRESLGKRWRGNSEEKTLFFSHHIFDFDFFFIQSVWGGASLHRHRKRSYVHNWSTCTQKQSGILSKIASGNFPMRPTRKSDPWVVHFSEARLHDLLLRLQRNFKHSSLNTSTLQSSQKKHKFHTPFLSLPVHELKAWSKTLNHVLVPHVQHAHNKFGSVNVHTHHRSLCEKQPFFSHLFTPTTIQIDSKNTPSHLIKYDLWPGNNIFAWNHTRGEKNSNLTKRHFWCWRV